jgi:hypothetical protein
MYCGDRMGRTVERGVEQRVVQYTIFLVTVSGTQSECTSPRNSKKMSRRPESAAQAEQRVKPGVVENKAELGTDMRIMGHALQRHLKWPVVERVPQRVDAGEWSRAWLPR